jgi:hypothetical protein
MLLRDFAERRKFRDTGIGEDDVKLSFCFDDLIKTVKVGQFGNVSLNASNVATDCFHGLVEFLLTTARDEDVGTLLTKSFAAANPIPVVPPVITATFPCSFLVSVIGSFPHSPLFCWDVVLGMVSSGGYLAMVGRLGNRNSHAAPRRRRFPNPPQQEGHFRQTSGPDPDLRCKNGRTPPDLPAPLR